MDWGYGQSHSLGPEYSEGSLDPSDLGVGYRGHVSRKLPYPAPYSDHRKTSRESNSGDSDLDQLSLERRGLVDRQVLERRELSRRNLDQRELSRIEQNSRHLDSHRRGLETRDWSRRDLVDQNRRKLERRDLVERRIGVPEEGYLPDSAESGSTDADTFDSQNMESQGRVKKREPSSRRPQVSTHSQIAQLEKRRMEILEELKRIEGLKLHYSEQLHAQTALLQKLNHKSPEYDKVNSAIQHILQNMHGDMGAPEQNEQAILDLRKQLQEVERRLESFGEHRSAFRAIASPPNSQASVPDSSQWSSTQNDYGYGDEGQYPRLPVPSENDSGIFGTEGSDINQSTSSSASQHKAHQHHYGSASQHTNSQPLHHHHQQQHHQQHHQPHPHHHPPPSHLSQTSDGNNRRYLPELPPSLQPKLHTSVSMEDHLGSDDLEIPLRSFMPRRRGLPVHTLSQQDPPEWHHNAYMGSPASLSQASQPPPWQYLEVNHHYRKRTGSPASSDSSSCYNSANERLRSAPGSVVSFPGSTLSSSTTSSLNSSRSGSKGVLPRPAVPSSSRYYQHPSIPEYVQKSRSEVAVRFPQRSQRRYESESPEDDSMSLPSLPVRKSANPVRPAPPPPANHRDSRDASPSNRPVPSAPSSSSSIYRQKKPQQDKLPEEKGSRDSLKMKLDMLIHVIKMFSSKTGKENDGDAANLLLALSRTAETVEVMHQPACLNMLIQIIHNIEYKEDRNHQEVRARAAETLRNIIESKGETRQGKHDLCVLQVLEKIRTHCDEMFGFVATHPVGKKIDLDMQESLHNSCEALLGPVRKLYKYSNDKEKYRPSVLTLGGLQAMAEVLIVNYRLLDMQKKTPGRHGDRRICHSSKIVTAIISILLSLTYGDVDNKTVLCTFDRFLEALMFHIGLQNESIIASGAQVLRNLSWRATKDIKQALLVHDAGITLMSALDYCNEEATLQYITSALWNLSAHSVESRERISSTQNGILQLVNLLSYNSPSGSMSVVENVGGILKNLSVVIKDGKYRKKFREAGGLAKLSHHLKSKNKTVLANATGILWNLSAHHYEDQKTLWDLGCIPLLDIHRTSEHKSIRENARGALRNLLAFGRTHGWSSRSDVVGYNLKTQQGLSKSLSIAASYTFGHLSQPQPQKHSSESLNDRFSAPLRSKSSNSTTNGTAKGSTGSLSQSKPHRHSSNNASGGYPCPPDDTDFGASSAHQKGSNRLKFKRIASAPQASSFSGNEHDLQDERFSYMPSCSSNQPNTFSATNGGMSMNGSKHSVSMEPGYPDDHGYPDLPEQQQRDNRSRSAKSKNSQSGLSPYGYSYSQEMHMSVPLSNEHSDVGGTSLSVLESKLERFDLHQPAAGQEVNYVDLELEDDDDDIDQPVQREPPPPPQSGREKATSLKFGISKNISSSRLSGMPHSGMPHSGMPHSGTGKLTLDGKGEEEVKPKRSGV